MITRPSPLKYCNCATPGCEVELLGDSCKAWFESLPKEEQILYKEPVAGRIQGRPYCRKCLTKKLRNSITYRADKEKRIIRDKRAKFNKEMGKE